MINELSSVQLKDGTNVSVGVTVFWQSLPEFRYPDGRIVPPRFESGVVESLYYQNTGRYDGRYAWVVDDLGERSHHRVNLLFGATPDAGV